MKRLTDKKSKNPISSAQGGLCVSAEFVSRLAAIEDILGDEYELDRLRELAPVRHAKWKHFHKQNKAVCTNCSFERDLSADFGAAIACPNCGAIMEKE